MKKLLKNRTLIGASCIVLSLVICFGLTPLFNNAMTAQTEIMRVKSEIKKGELITPTNWKPSRWVRITYREHPCGQGGGNRR